MQTGGQKPVCLKVQAIGGVNYWDDAGLYNVTGGCSKIFSLPTITFTLDGTDYPLSPQEYILQVRSSHRQRKRPVINLLHAHGELQHVM